MSGLGRGNLLLAVFRAGTTNNNSVWPFLLQNSRTMKTAAAECIQFPFGRHEFSPMELRTRRRFGTTPLRQAAANDDDKAMEQFFGYKVKSNTVHYKEIEQRILRVVKEIAPKFDWDPELVEDLGLSMQVAYFKHGKYGSSEQTMEMLHALEDEFGLEFETGILTREPSLHDLYTYICHELGVTIEGGDDANTKGQNGNGEKQKKMQQMEMPGRAKN